MNIRHKVASVGAFLQGLDNGLQVLATIAVGSVSERLAPELKVRSRRGAIVRCPNRPLAQAPLEEVLVRDCYRMSELEHRLAGRAVHVVDIGAHVGTFAMELARRLPLASITCYEPSPATFRFLCRNIADNDLNGRVLPIEVAVLDHVGPVSLQDGGLGSCVNAVVSVRHGCTVQVEARAWAHISAAEPAGYDFVKMDCEGAEYSIILNSTARDWARVQAVLLEYHPVDGHDGTEVLSRLREYGFHPLWHEPGMEPGLGTAMLERR